MLLDPKAITGALNDIVDGQTPQAPHTALLLLPQGRPLASVTLSSSFDDDADEEYLEPEERLRLLSGLAAQWDPSESARMECEVS